MNSVDQAPANVGRWLGWASVLVLLIAMAGIGLISAEVFDPRPLGQLTVERQLEPIRVDSNSEELIWLGEKLPDGRSSLRLLVALGDGEADVGYGLAIGDEAHQLVSAVSPLGYLAIWERSTIAGRARVNGQSNVEERILPWQAWPHVRLGTDSNEIWVDVVDGQAKSVRINRELLWQGNVPIAGQRVGIWAESFGRTAEVAFQQIQLFARN